MATQKTKTWDDYYREEKAKNDAAVRAEREQRQKRDEESIRSFDSAVDRQTDETVRGYRRDMAEDAAERRDLLDTNALAEALTRRQIRDRMADLGLSHSGLAEAQGKAAGAARSSADRTVAEGRLAAQERLQSAIDRVVSEAAEKKAKNSLSMRQSTEKWAAERMGKAQTQAKTYADKAYAAEQRRLADVQKALLQQQKKAQQTAQSKTTAVEKQQKSAETAFKKAVTAAREQGYPADSAQIVAKVKTSDGYKNAADKQDMIERALAEAAKQELTQTGFSVDVLLPDHNGLRGYKDIYDRAIRLGDQAEMKKALELLVDRSVGKTTGLSSHAREYAQAVAMGRLLGSLDKGRSEDDPVHRSMVEVLERMIRNGRYLAAARDAMNATPYEKTWTAELFG